MHGRYSIEIHCFIPLNFIVYVSGYLLQEELRNSIKSMVKQSAALNHPGAENIKRRQLSDGIHQEVG